MTRIDVCGLRMNDGTADASGTTWWVKDLDGWDSPGVRLGVRDLLGEDGGVFSGDKYHGPRAIVVSGVAKIGPSDDIFQALRRLADVTEVVAVSGLLEVYEPAPGVYKRATVRRAGRLRTDMRSPALLEWELPLIAADPRLYSGQDDDTWSIFAGDTQDSGVIVNAGTYDSPPDLIELTDTGGADWIEIEQLATGQKIRLADAGGVMGAADQINIDPQARTVRLDGGGSVYSKVDPSTRWWFLRPGNNTIRLKRQGSAGTTSITMYYRSAWI